jgi:hypothetical protein
MSVKTKPKRAPSVDDRLRRQAKQGESAGALRFHAEQLRQAKPVKSKRGGR